MKSAICGNIHSAPKDVLHNIQGRAEDGEGVYLVGHFAVRTEFFGYVLVRGNRVVPVGHQAKPILDALDGRSTPR